jgi:D-beta-D-heptose 7-phosphate kinase/D-beta-D-heptose 1-phosphate adenosyltransferase
MNLMYPNKFIPIDTLKDRNFTLAFTNGCFDILHSGHIQSLIFAKSKADKLIVALNTDNSIKKLKGNLRPILPLEHRINVISALEVVDYVTYFDDETPLHLIKNIMPDVLVKGSDYNLEKIVGKEFVGKILLAPFYDGASTSTFLNEFSSKILNINL